MELQNLYTTKEAAEYLGMGKSTFKRYVRIGMIEPVIRRAEILLFSREDLDRFRETPRRSPGRSRKAS